MVWYLLSLRVQFITGDQVAVTKVDRNNTKLLSVLHEMLNYEINAGNGSCIHFHTKREQATLIRKSTNSHLKLGEIIS